MTERSIVVICLDSVRKDYFDRYAPRIQQLADSSFDQCRAASSWTLPSHASMFSGLLPHQHGIHIHNRDFTELNKFGTFLSELPNHKKIGVSANLHAGSSFGFDYIFDDFTDISQYRRFPEGMDVRQYIHKSEKTGPGRYLDFIKMAKEHDATGKSLLNGLVAKLNYYSRHSPLPKMVDEGANAISRKIINKASDCDQPFFLFANFMEAHPPHEHIWGFDREKHGAPNNWTSRGLDGSEILDVDRREEEDVKNSRQLYAAAIDYLDRKIEDLVITLQDTVDEEITFIITSDHGSNKGYKEEDYLFGHWDSLSEAVLHAPLYLINSPSGYKANEPEYFSHLDLGELITGLVTSETPDIFKCRIAAERVGGYTYKDEERMLRCVYNGNTKTVWDSVGNIDDYSIDFSKSCWQRHGGKRDELPEIANQFFDESISTYKHQAKSQSGNVREDLDAAQRKQLENLGYL